MVLSDTLTRRHGGLKHMEVFMVRSGVDMSTWKIEQIRYFRNYLTAFDSDSKEYSIIMKGISEIEKTV